MPAYPSYPQLEDSILAWVDDIQVDRATGGGTKVRGYFTAPKARLVLRHFLTASERAALQSFYVTNRLAASGTIAVTFVGDGQTYQCLFAGPPRYTWKAGYTLAEVELLQQ